MRKHFFFRKGEIGKWLDAYRQSKAFVKLYKHYLGEEQKRQQREQFKEADRIVREFWVLRCAVEAEERDLLEKYVERGTSSLLMEILQDQNIIENWEQVVLFPKAHTFTVFNSVAFGSRLKALREVRCFYRAEAARYLDIRESTLRSYEDGTRIIRIDTFIKIIG